MSRLVGGVFSVGGLVVAVLVAFDIHMRRSVGAFRAQGISALPAIAPDLRSWRPWVWWIRPTPEGLDWIRGWWRSS